MIRVIIFMMTVTNIVLIDKRCKNNSHNNYRYDKNENATRGIIGVIIITLSLIMSVSRKGMIIIIITVIMTTSNHYNNKK